MVERSKVDNDVVRRHLALNILRTSSSDINFFLSRRLKGKKPEWNKEDVKKYIEARPRVADQFLSLHTSFQNALGIGSIDYPEVVEIGAADLFWHPFWDRNTHLTVIEPFYDSRKDQKKHPGQFTYLKDKGPNYPEIKNDSIDAITGFSVFPLFPDLKERFKEYKRVLKKGGFVASFNYTPTSSSFTYRLFPEDAKNISSHLRDKYKIDLGCRSEDKALEIIQKVIRREIQLFSKQDFSTMAWLADFTELSLFSERSKYLNQINNEIKDIDSGVISKLETDQLYVYELPLFYVLKLIDKIIIATDKGNLQLHNPPMGNFATAAIQGVSLYTSAVYESYFSSAAMSHGFEVSTDRVSAFCPGGESFIVGSGYQTGPATDSGRIFAKVLKAKLNKK